jgi:hypothetical protein
MVRFGILICALALGACQMAPLSPTLESSAPERAAGQESGPAEAPVEVNPDLDCAPRPGRISC